MKKFFSLLFTLVSIGTCHVTTAQVVSINWQKSYGGSSFDGTNHFRSTPDGGYIVAGYSASADGDITNNKGGQDFWILKLDATGTLQWQKNYGGSDDEAPVGIVRAPGGGYVIVGETYSSDGDVTGANQGSGDVWILMLDDTGKVLWDKTLGGTDWDFANRVDTTMDGNVIVTGGTFSSNGDFATTLGAGDAWVAKITPAGNVSWLKTYGGNGTEYAFDVHPVPAGGYIVAASSTVLNANGYVIRLDDTGKVAWQKTYGGTGYDQALSIKPAGNGFIMASMTTSNNGQVSGNHGGVDIWLTKINDTGALQWQKCYGGSGDDYVGAIEPLANGHFIFSAETASSNGDVTNNHGGADVWVVRVNDTGAIVWQKTFGGSDDDSSFSMVNHGNSTYTIGCISKSSDGDATVNKGECDIWMVNIQEYFVGIDEVNDASTAFKVYPTINNGTFTVQSPVGIENAEMKLFDINGRELRMHATKNSEGYNVVVPDAIPGNYLLRISVIDSYYVHKIVIEPR